jgi:CelD/BcsL family acetyltransferase involved in cellulose biosynthesis
MEITIREFDSLESAKETWSAFQEQGELYIFQTHEWLENWYTNVGVKQPIQPWLVAVYTDTGRPLCFFPFGIERRKFVTVLTWLGEAFIDYGAPIVTPVFTELLGSVEDVDFNDIWDMVIEHIPPVDMIWLAKIPETINRVKNPICALKCKRYHSSAYYVRLSGDWDDFYRRHAGAKTRSTDRRKHRRLSETGSLSFCMTDGSDESVFRDITGAMIEQKQNRYREILAPDFLDPEPHKRFFMDPSRALLTSGVLNISGLRLNGKIITTHWGMTYRGRYYYYMPSFAGGHWMRYSPGRLLLFHLFKWCLQRGIEVFDFTIGDEAYKRDWCDTELNLYQFCSVLSRKGKLYEIYYGIRLLLLGNRFFRNMARTIRQLMYRIRYRAF